jgi:sulfur-oxidizing protein SoxX
MIEGARYDLASTTSRRHRWRSAVLALLAVMSSDTIAADAAGASASSFKVVGNGIPEPLAGAAGDAARGRALLVKREAANCVLCHAVPDSAIPFSGDLGPSLAGVGARLSVAELRLRVADSLRLNPETIMPSYYKIDGLDRVATTYQGKPILSGQEVEDVVAYLVTLR